MRASLLQDFGSGRSQQLSLAKRILRIPWGLTALIVATCSIGFVVLYSAAGGSLDPWASRQMYRFAAGFVLMLLVALTDIRLWFKAAYPAYALGLVLLVLVHIMGTTGMGAQRWLEVGPLQLQPSELMKIAMVLVLARYFHGLSQEKIGNPLYLLWPVVLVLVPAALILKQPKLGTTLLMLLTAAAMFFCAGVRIWKFIGIGMAAAGALPLAWSFLRDYQKQRVLTFLDPESDPLGAGYHIIQSKIALGSGGLWGKGFLNGTQGHLQFLPERQTDFIFSMLSEEFGLVGGLVLLGLYTAILFYSLAISLRARSQFARLMAIGIATAFFANAFVNLAMVMGLVPVVGEPLPFLSYGGTAMITLLIGFGLVMNALVYADTPNPGAAS